MLTTAIPILPAADLDAIQAFCREKLGFSVDHAMPGYCIVSRDGVTLHFFECREPKIAEWTACYLHVTDVDALYAEYAAAGIIHPNGKLEDKPWGMREFAALTPEGVMLRIGRPSAGT
jgi:catechol 2,3-dioxygenase-like lactoylglutathione lyase family enzyme